MSDRDIDELFRKFAELDAELKLLRKELDQMKFPQTYTGINLSSHIHTGTVSNQPLQWPNESYTEYLKRIGQCNEPSSDNEKWDEENK